MIFDTIKNCGIYYGIDSRFEAAFDFIKEADMKEYTTFRIGGPCDLAVFPHDRENFCAVIDFVIKNNRHTGSNFILKDKFAVHYTFHSHSPLILLQVNSIILFCQ